MTYRNRKVEQCVFNFYKTIPKELVQFAFDIERAVLSLGNCSIHSYQEIAALNDISVEEVAANCNSYTGCTHKENDHYIIMYNDSPHISHERKVFTLAHELGHILLGHLSILESFKIFQNNFHNEHFERESNYFAASVLSPVPILYRIQPKSILPICEIFGLSSRAAKITFDNYMKYNKNYNIQWHNDIIEMFDFQCKTLETRTYQLDCEPDDDDFPPGIQIDKCYPSCNWIMPIKKSEVYETEKPTIPPNLYERVVLDWI